MVAGAALLMRNPPEGWKPAGWEPSEAQKAQRSARDYTMREAVGTWQWYALWTLLFLNVTAGIAIISQAAGMAREITGASAIAAAGLVGVISIANGSGRFLWAWLSDFIGRKWVFLAMFLIQAVVFFLMPRATSLGLFTTLAFIVLLCYGGGFGTMPAFAADYFGPKNVASVYGLMLTAWGVAGIVGPQLIARMRESTGNYRSALYVIAAIMLVSAVVPFIVPPPLSQQEAAAEEAPPKPSPAPPRSRAT